MISLAKFARENFCAVFVIFLSPACFANTEEMPSKDINCHDSKIIELVSKAKQEISDRMYMTLATSDPDSNPWNTPVYTAFDESSNFYWMSATTSQHSLNIRSNHKTFAIIYNSTAMEGTGFGVYMRGNSYELNNSDFEEIKHGINTLAARIHRTDIPPVSDYLAPNPRRVYKFNPKQVWVNVFEKIDGKYIDKRIEITQCLL